MFNWREDYDQEDEKIFAKRRLRCNWKISGRFNQFSSRDSVITGKSSSHYGVVKRQYKINSKYYLIDFEEDSINKG